MRRHGWRGRTVLLAAALGAAGALGISAAIDREPECVAELTPARIVAIDQLDQYAEPAMVLQIEQTGERVRRVPVLGEPGERITVLLRPAECRA